MKHDTLIGASNGSVLDGRGYHAFCVAMKNTANILVEAVAPVDGPKQTMVSYRAETFGALAIIRIKISY